MKKKLIFSFLLFTGTFAFSQSKTIQDYQNGNAVYAENAAKINSQRIGESLREPVNTAPVGVIINGITWAARNVASPGTFADSPESYGGLFDGNEAPNVCPKGWQLPTVMMAAEIAVAGVRVGELNGIKGTWLGPKGRAVFLPSAGFGMSIPGFERMLTEDYMGTWLLSYSTVKQATMILERMGGFENWSMLGIDPSKDRKYPVRCVRLHLEH